MEKPFLMLLDGMTGAGKSTTAKLLAPKLPRTAIIGMDRVKHYLTDFEKGVRDNTIARTIVFAMADKYLELGLSVMIEHPLRTEEEVKLYDELAKKYSVAYYKFQLFTTPEIAHARIVVRQKNHPNPNPEDRILRNIGLFEGREHLGFTMIDTSTLSEDGAANLILEKISNHSGV